MNAFSKSERNMVFEFSSDVSVAKVKWVDRQDC